MLYQESEIDVYEGLRTKKGIREISFKEMGFSVKTIKNDDDMLKAFKLRHQIFAEELKWVPTTPAALEIDEYEDNAVSFGVFNDNDDLCAYMRLIMPERPFMMEKEFLALVSPDHKIRKSSDTAEISRLCVAPQARNETISGNFGMHSTSMLLLKGMYHWCFINGIDYLYAVTEEKIYRLYRAKGFPFKPIGEPMTMPDGVVAAALMMNWREFEELNLIKRPKMFQWFNQVQSAPSPRRLPRHEYGLQRQASV